MVTRQLLCLAGLAVLTALAGLAVGQSAPAVDTQPAGPAVRVAEESGPQVLASGRATARPGANDAQARLMAQRGARVTAMRNLARKLYGEDVRLDETGAGAATMDVLLKGAYETSVQPLGDNAYEVTVAITPRTLAQNLAVIWQDNRRLGSEKDRLASQLQELRAENDRVLADNNKLHKMVITMDEQNRQAAKAAGVMLKQQRDLVAETQRLGEELRIAQARLAELEPATQPAAGQ